MLFRNLYKVSLLLVEANDSVRAVFNHWPHLFDTIIITGNCDQYLTNVYKESKAFLRKKEGFSKFVYNGLVLVFFGR